MTTPASTVIQPAVGGRPQVPSSAECGPAALLGGLLLAALGVAVASDAWADILQIALRDEESSQVLLVPFVVAWLVWVRRGRLADCPREATWIGPLLVAAGWGVLTVGYHHAIQSFWHGGAVLVAVGCLLSVAGAPFARRFLPALAVLVFLVPVPGMVRQRIAIPLQAGSARLAQTAFDILGYDVLRSGNVLNFNGVDVAVAEACNGMRMVFALVLVTYAFAFGAAVPRGMRWLLIALSPLVALACNVLRLIPTVWIYGSYSRATAKTFHDVSGWLMLPLAFVVLLGVVRLARWVVAPAFDTGGDAP